MEDKNKKVSSAIRGARTMGPGREGVDQDALMAIMMSGTPLPNSVMPNAVPAQEAQRILADQRMAAMLRAIEQAQRIPSPVTR